MAEKLSSLGGGGVFVVSEVSPFFIDNSGVATGEVIFQLTPPLGQRVFLTALILNTGFTQTSIEGSVQGVVFNYQPNPTAANQRAIGNPSGDTVTASAGFHPPLLFGVDEIVTVRNTDASASGQIFYSYSFGSIK